MNDIMLPSYSFKDKIVDEADNGLKLAPMLKNGFLLVKRSKG